MALVFIDPVEVTPGAAGSWQDVDLSTYLPAGATGAILLAVENFGAGSTFATRKNGSTDNRLNPIGALGFIYSMCGVDANRVCEVYVGHATRIDVYIIGYTTEGFVFFDNAVNKSLGTAAAWTDIDCSTEAPDAVGLMFDVVYALQREFGIRKNGSTDDRHPDKLGGTSLGLICIGCDVGQIAEGYVENTGASIFLTGYITAAASITFNTNATDLSLGTTGAWTDLAALPNGATSAIIEITATGALSYGLRKNGALVDRYADLTHHLWTLVECDENGIIEGKIESTAVDFFVVGYTTAPAAAAISRSLPCFLQI